MSKTIEDLREILFKSIDDLQSGKIDVAQAKAVSEISQTIINTAKIEIDYIRAKDGHGGSSFVGVSYTGGVEPTKNGHKEVSTEGLPNGISSVTKHFLKD